MGWWSVVGWSVVGGYNKTHFKVPKTIRLNTAHYFIIKIPHKREL